MQVSLDTENPVRTMSRAGQGGTCGSRMRLQMVTKKPYTDKQGQYLAFIYYYTKINGRAPS